MEYERHSFEFSHQELTDRVRFGRYEFKMMSALVLPDEVLVYPLEIRRQFGDFEKVFKEGE